MISYYFAVQMRTTVKMSDNPISGIQLFNTCRTRLLDRFFLEMPGVTQREIVTDGLSCLSKKKNVQTGSRVIRLSSPRCNFTRVLNIKIKNRMWKLHMTDSWERQGEKGFCYSTSQKRNSRDVQKNTIIGGKNIGTTQYTIQLRVQCALSRLQFSLMSVVFCCNFEMN